MTKHMLLVEIVWEYWVLDTKEIIRKPKLTNFESFVDIYAKYLKITNKAIHFEDQNSVSILLRDKYANEFSHGNNKMSQIMEKFHVLNKLNFEFKQRVKILYFFGDVNILIIKL
jgi:hypothetical protein